MIASEFCYNIMESRLNYITDQAPPGQSLICNYTMKKGKRKMDLLELRKQLDELDVQIVALYEKRMDISSQVADYKIETGKKEIGRASCRERV